MTLLIAGCAASEVLFRPAKFYVDSRDAVDDGAGNVLSVADRINGWSFAADASGNRPNIDTALLGGTQLIRFTTNADNLQYVTSDTGFGGDDTPVSFVCRYRRTTNVTRTMLTTHVTNVPPTAADGANLLKTNAETSIQVQRDEAGGPVGSYDATTTITNNTWYTYGCSFDGGNVRIFKNGVFISTHASALNSLGTHTTITLGNASGLTTASLGYIAVWKGWTAAISDAQHLYEHNQAAAWAA